VFCLLIPVLALTCLAAPMRAAERETVNVSLFTWPGYGFWFIAKEKNFAPDLKLNIRVIENPYDSFALMKSGQLDVTSSTIEYGPIAASSGNPARLVTFANLSYGTDKIVFGPDIEQASDLKGESVAVLKGGLPQIFFGIFLERQGMSFDDVNYINATMDNALAAMISGQVAAAEFWEPYGSQAISRIDGARAVVDSRQDFWLEKGLLADACYMRAGFIENRPATARKTLGALYKAIDFWMNNPSAGNKIIAKGLGIEVDEVERVIGAEGKSKKGGLYIYSLKEAARFMGVAEGAPPFGQAHNEIQDHFQLTNRWWKRFGLVDATYDYTDGVNKQVIKQVWQQHQK
jgi:NitT/TauT family transport system substrate-binding protein